ncbi:MAG: hypothetical protein ABEH56_07550 [Salinirussus sp.]
MPAQATTTSGMTRYETTVDDGTIYVGTADGPLAVGSVDAALSIVGGPSWTIRYSEKRKAERPGIDTSDEGLTVDVVDMMQAMTHSERFVETLAAQPREPTGGDDVSPRLGLFVGKLLENLESGVD